jgi:polysaccharide export outer membrane protein
VAGKTVVQASKELRDALDKRFIVNPQLSFTVVEFSKRKFTVLGQVQRPGIYEYSGDERMTLLQALALAGGFTRMASPRKVTVKRLDGGEVKTYSLKNEADPSNPAAIPFEIRPGDTINVGARIL